MTGLYEVEIEPEVRS
jgi:phage-related protein